MVLLICSFRGFLERTTEADQVGLTRFDGRGSQFLADSAGFPLMLHGKTLVLLFAALLDVPESMP